MHDHDDDHDHDHHHDNELSPMAARVKALETILVGKGLVDPKAIDVIVDTYENKVGPQNGAHVVAKAWRDTAFADWLRRDATAAIASLGYGGRQGEHMQAVFNTGTTPQPHRLHPLLLLPVVGAWSAAGLVQGAALSLARGDRSARRARRVRADAAGPRPRSASGTRQRNSAISSCRNAPSEPTAGARNSSPPSSRATR